MAGNQTAIIPHLDSGVSGFATDAPSLKAIKTGYKNWKIKTVIVKDLQQLSRSLELQEKIGKVFKQYGITLNNL